MKKVQVQAHVDFHYRTPIRKTEFKSFGNSVIKYLKESMKTRLPKLKFSEPSLEHESELSSKFIDARIRTVTSYLHIALDIKSYTINTIMMTDVLLNGLMSFLGKSQYDIRRIYVEYEKSFAVKSNPLSKLIKHGALADFNATTKQDFDQTGIVLSSVKKEMNMFVMLLYYKKEGIVVFTAEREINRITYDLIKELDQAINKSKPLIFNTLGVSAK